MTPEIRAGAMTAEDRERLPVVKQTAYAGTVTFQEAGYDLRYLCGLVDRLIVSEAGYRAALAEAEQREAALVEALDSIVGQVGSRYDDQWAVGPVLLIDLDAARDTLAASRAARGPRP